MLYTVSDDKDDRNRREKVAQIIENIGRECRCAVLVLDRIDTNVTDSLRKHDSPEIVVKEYTKDSVLSEFNNMMFLHKDNFYRVSDQDEDFINIVYNDGFHGKGRRYINCIINKKTGKIYDLEDSADTIVFVVASYYNMDPKYIKSKDRAPEVVKARQIAMYICCEKKYSLNEISRCFEGNEILAVMHAHNRIEEELKTDQSLADEINKILERL